MAEEKQFVISNPKISDSSSKLIFGDKILSSQFFRDYADMEILRNIQPEDVEDVSERYVPLYSTERESDTVKKVDISRYLPMKDKENQLNLPLYIISLIEHKTKVEYNVGMQILRYMIYIWEDYEKEMDKQHPGISSRKEFRYPPILPIVYYEGDRKWTAPLNFSDRILCGELLGKYLPHFEYQLVRLHDYSNADLLEKGDEISLAMLINKIQSPEDISAFVRLPGEQVCEILKDTPQYLLDTIAKLLRALLYSMNLPEDETESVVSRIKERKMARLFENVKIDIQQERKNIAEVKKEYDDTKKKYDDTKKKYDDTKKKYDDTKKKYDDTRKKYDDIKKKCNAVEKEFEIYKQINRMIRNHCPESEIKNYLMEQYSLTDEQAVQEYEKVMRE